MQCFNLCRLPKEPAFLGQLATSYQDTQPNQNLLWSDNSELKIFCKRQTTLTCIRVAIRCCSFPHIEAARDCATQDLGACEGATGRQLIPTRDHAYLGRLEQWLCCFVSLASVTLPFA